MWMHFCRYLRSFVDIYESVFQFIGKALLFLKLPEKVDAKMGSKVGTTESAAERPLIVSQRRAATCDEHAHEQGDPRP